MKVQRRADTLRALDATAVFVVFDDPALIRRTMLADVDLQVPVLVDRDRAAYDAWGLSRLEWWKVWLDPNVWRVYARLIASGERLRGLGTDTTQMGGDFVVDRASEGEGTDDVVVWARPQQRDDRPPTGELLGVVRGLQPDA